MSDPLNASGLSGGRPTSWVGFDEISMTTPANFANSSDPTSPEEDGNKKRLSVWDGTQAAKRRDSVAREESLDMDGGRDSVAREERLDVEDGDRPVVTPLPTQEMIADPAKLGAAPVVHAMQEYQEKKAPPQSMATPGPILSSNHADINLANSKIIATVYPENNSCAWVIPPRYDPYAMPSILTSRGLSMPPEDFVTAMELITNDYRFRSFSTLYSRLVAFWMSLSIVILLIVLFSNTEGGVPVMVFCIFWCFMLFAGIIGCAIIRKQIRIGMRHCVQSANKILIRNDVIAGIEDKGQMSCHKVVIHFMTFRTMDCLPDIERLIRIEASGGAVVYGGQAHAAPAKEMTKKQVEDKARELILKYSQDYVKDTVKHRIVFPSRPAHGVSDYIPKHCKKQMCLCQYIDKNHYNRSPKKWYARFV